MITETPGVDPDDPPEQPADGASVSGTTISIPLLRSNINTLIVPRELPPAGAPARWR